MTDFAAHARDRAQHFLTLLAQWVAIPSPFDAASLQPDAPFGRGVADALGWWQKLGDDAGLNTLNVDNHAVHIEYGSGEEIVYVFGHADVVPAGDGWHFPPYQLSRLGDNLIGRGVVDDKGPMIAAWLALDILRELNLPLSRRIRLVAGGNEESGFRCIRRYFESQPQPAFAFTPDGKFPVIYGEKGSLLVTLTSPVEQPGLTVSCGSVLNTIPDVARLNGLSLSSGGWTLPDGFTLLAEPGQINHWQLYGRGGHSSKPEACLNPIAGAAQLLHQRFSARWTQQLCEITAPETGQSGVQFALDTPGECGQILLVPVVLNIKNGMVSLTLNVRYPENLTPEYIAERLTLWNLSWPDSRISIEPVKSPSLYPPDSALVKTLHEIYTRHTGDTNHPSRTTGAGSYASAMQNAVIFGCEFPDGSSGNTHGADEYGSLSRFISAIGIYAEALYRLANLPAAPSDNTR
ncbi:Sapep family Mn(2+)-dependent dipeptidase [Rahnella sp. ChDrAdgB13]|uniref:Sapep family Mn(2+)-dependent dipeptidase n=1 Tax=Rahnella sp. ChDrAdgB13 TaxID=1850581 RepID=UPI001AD86038|nr:Sapep family Mn(2+)-dependent dipeptidase [Rahnella sp. ChDrAdgB13]